MKKALGAAVIGAAVLAAAAAAAVTLNAKTAASVNGNFAAAPAAHAAESGACVPILMYHEVKPEGLGKDAISPWELESDLEYLRDAGYTAVSMQALEDFCRDKKPLPPKPVVLTFDDGYYNNYVCAYPLLKKYGVHAVLSVIGRNTDDFTEIPSDNINYSHVTWTQLNEMLSSGVFEAQNHTYDMHSISWRRFGCMRGRGESEAEYERALRGDVGRLQNEMKTMTGTLPTVFAYPYGRRSAQTEKIIAAMGFRATLTCDYGVNILTPGSEKELFGLRRICRTHGTGAKRSIDEAMKTLKYRKKQTGSE
jgi:peptidoglycan/xylan/chitin deacetylase (PgdA/CDA1 family)